MSKWKNVQEYWADLLPRLTEYLQKSRKQPVSEFLRDGLIFFSFHSEDLGSKVRANSHIHPKLDLFVAYAHDQLRAAPVLYENLNLAPAAISARAAFENYVSLSFITSSTDAAVLADRYHRFKDIEKLKGLRNSPFLDPLPEEEEKRILAANPEWVDSTSGKLVKKPHWTGINGMSVETMVKQIGKADYYSLYRTTSSFVHASPITVNLYSSFGQLRSVSSENQSRRMSLLIALFALETLVEYCRFFSITYDYPGYLALMTKVSELNDLP